MRIEIIGVIIAVIIGGCAGFYGAMKALERSAQKRREVVVSTVSHLTLLYVKDWIQTELGEPDSHRSISLVQPELLEAIDEKQAMMALIPNHIQQESEHILLILAKRGDTVYKTYALKYETMDEALRGYLQQGNGVLNIQGN